MDRCAIQRPKIWCQGSPAQQVGTQGEMIISCDFGFRRRVGKCILLSGFLGFCLFSGKSGFFRLALLFGKPFLFGTLLGF